MRGVEAISFDNSMIFRQLYYYYYFIFLINILIYSHISERYNCNKIGEPFGNANISG